MENRNSSLTIYTIYENPSDHPNKFVVRKFVGETPEQEPVGIVDNLDQARELIPPGLSNIGRYDDDDIVIIEVWI